MQSFVASRLFFAATVLAAGAFSGCSCEVDLDDDGVDGEGGSAPTCAEGGTGTLEIVVTGLPSGVSADVTVSGPSGDRAATGSESIAAAASGDYDVTAGIVTTADPIVRIAYAPTVDHSALCLADGATGTVTVTYTAIPTSNKLWLTNGSGGTGQLLGFASEVLGATTTTPATVAATGGAGNDVAFDKDGNLWAMGATLADATLLRYPAGSLGSSGAKAPDREIWLPNGCIPLVAGMAFDPEGNLWVTSPCDRSVMKLAAAELEASGERTPSVVLRGFDDGPRGIAFDADGALWVADPARSAVVRFDASRLGASTETPDKVVIATQENTAPFGPSWIAFDGSGALWVNDFGANAVFRVPATDLAGTDEVTLVPPTTITIGVLALLESMAFDESGGLWMAGSQGTFIRLGPEQLDESSGPGDPTMPATVVTSADVGYATNFAFYPAPASLPLFHAID